MSAHFGSTYTKIGTIQRRSAWLLRTDDTQVREVFNIFNKPGGEGQIPYDLTFNWNIINKRKKAHKI